jgi:hypothetical protein
VEPERDVVERAAGEAARDQARVDRDLGAKPVDGVRRSSGAVNGGFRISGRRSTRRRTGSRKLNA